MNLLRRHKWLAALLLVLAVGLTLCWSCYQSTCSLTCTGYTVPADKITEPIRILQLTDLHNSVFGEENQTLLELAAEQAPDLILITGDLLNANEARTDIATDLISGLCSIAPVFVSLGNHEVEYQETFGADVTALYEAAGATVLEQQYQEVTVNGQQLRLGGIYGYCLPAKYLETNEADPEECAFLWDFQDTDTLTVLMCHMPVSWLINGGLDEWEADVVFSGHVHGGQVIFPLIGGLYAPDLGLFPGRLEGLYTSEDGTKTLVLSRGLGNTELFPRVNNIPELVTVDLVPQSQTGDGIP